MSEALSFNLGIPQVGGWLYKTEGRNAGYVIEHYWNTTASGDILDSVAYDDPRIIPAGDPHYLPYSEASSRGDYEGIDDGDPPPWWLAQFNLVPGNYKRASVAAKAWTGYPEMDAAIEDFLDVTLR